ncbi:hypothetical protein ROLI_029000 [Roseobacter fucihabitans]|uniref:AAA+ family ATPase n=1 Tax=Roseobacter fucihabitans TaxID=1537242 RepID=A0ABZ2BUX0_9RHOB|nr:hypothetical protein [Roseobacter litoralis]MBC6964818.1 hypothetical protein [Roseobacter litoralis]
MKNLLIALFAVLVLSHPLRAQEEDAPSIMERGAQQFLEGLLLEMEPAFEGMRGFMQEMGPALSELMGQIEDWSVYEAPEILENGDIIIRRKPQDIPPEETPPQIEL